MRLLRDAIARERDWAAGLHSVPLRPVTWRLWQEQGDASGEAEHATCVVQQRVHACHCAGLQMLVR
jgi:hypothetical protein